MGVARASRESPLSVADRPLPSRPWEMPQRTVAQRGDVLQSGPRGEVRKRPDPRPMRLAFGAGALAWLSVMSAGLVRLSAATATTTEVQVANAAQGLPPPVEARHVIRYIHLLPGQVAPPGATVISPKAPAPQVVVTYVAAPARTVRRIVVTRQSGQP